MTLVRYMDKDLLKQLPQCEGGEEDLCDIDPSKLLLEHVSRYCYHHDHQLNNSMFIIIHSPFSLSVPSSSAGISMATSPALG